MTTTTQIPGETEQQPDWLDVIMEDLFVGHNLNYAARAIREHIAANYVPKEWHDILPFKTATYGGTDVSDLILLRYTEAEMQERVAAERVEAELTALRCIVSPHNPLVRYQYKDGSRVALDVRIKQLEATQQAKGVESNTFKNNKVSVMGATPGNNLDSSLYDLVQIGREEQVLFGEKTISRDTLNSATVGQIEMYVWQFQHLLARQELKGRIAEQRNTRIEKHAVSCNCAAHVVYFDNKARKFGGEQEERITELERQLAELDKHNGHS
jgi:hypothetical protein